MHLPLTSWQYKLTHGLAFVPFKIDQKNDENDLQMPDIKHVNNRELETSLLHGMYCDAKYWRQGKINE